MLEGAENTEETEEMTLEIDSGAGLEEETSLIRVELGANERGATDASGRRSEVGTGPPIEGPASGPFPYAEVEEDATVYMLDVTTGTTVDDGRLASRAEVDTTETSEELEVWTPEAVAIEEDTAAVAKVLEGADKPELETNAGLTAELENAETPVLEAA